MTTESPAQSTAGNNILSQMEYDAVLSHIRVLSISTHADYQAVKSIWHFIRVGLAMTLSDINNALLQTASLPHVPGLGHEAERAVAALQHIFTRPPR